MSIMGTTQQKEIDRTLSYVQYALAHKDLKSAQPVIEKLYEVAKHDPIVLILYSEFLYQSKEFNEAKKIINETLIITPMNPFALKLLAKIFLDEGNYKSCQSILKNILQLSKKDKELELEVNYYIGLSYFREENFKEASKYLFAAQKINHLYKDLFHLCSQLTVINKLLESYDIKNNDHWFILAAYKTFRKFGQKKHQEKFLTELKEQHSHTLDYDLIKLDLEICSLIDEKAPNIKFQKLNETWVKKNQYTGCVFHFNEIYFPKRNFTPHKLSQ